MGQTPSKNQQNAEIYANYIQQQQDLIYQQQKQINELFTHNLQPPQHQQQQQQQQQPYTFNQSSPNQIPLPQLPSAKIRLDPYKILGLSKNYDETKLKKAYLKAAMKSHPDRGGTPEAFQQVSIAYTLLQNKLKEKDNNHAHNELRDGAKQYMTQQTNQPKVNVNMTENFDVDVFNKIYSENKVSEVYDEGYGSWMESNPALESGQAKMFQSGFNKDLFNSTFDQYKKEQSQKQGNQMVQYREPDVRISSSNQDSLMTLGQDKITDFGGTTDNLNFTDYKQAYTDGSTLIDTSVVDLSGRSNSMRGIKSQRSNLTYTMTPEDEQRQALLHVEEKKAEQNRIQRLNQMDQQYQQSYEKIHSMLLR